MGAAKVSGVCRLGADPELRFTPSGAAVCTARAIFQDRYLDKQSGEWKDGDALWVSLIAWRQQGENMAESFRKGDEVIVLDGTLKVREFDLKDGGKGYAVDVTAREFGPSARWHAAKSMRPDRNSDGPAAGPAEDPWDDSPRQQGGGQQGRRQQGYGPAGEARREAGRWMGSGEQVARPQGNFPDEPPF